MKKILFAAFAMLACALASAQTDSERYEQRYDMLVSQFGAAGVGVETVLDNWEKVDSTNAKLLLARFNYLFTKAQSVSVVMKDNKKYLGMDPVLSLKDSLGNDLYYYQENIFDDELYAVAMKAADKAIDLWPDRLDFRFMKANAYISYEKESPDLTLAYLMDLIDENVPIELRDPDFKIYARNYAHPSSYIAKSAEIWDSLITEGCEIEGKVDYSVLFSNVTVEEGAFVDYSIVMPGAVIKKGAVVQYAMVAENAVIEEGAVVGENPEKCENLENWGVAVVGAGVNVGKNAKVKAQSMISEDVKEGETV